MLQRIFEYIYLVAIGFKLVDAGHPLSSNRLVLVLLLGEESIFKVFYPVFQRQFLVGKL